MSLIVPDEEVRRIYPFAFLLDQVIELPVYQPLERLEYPVWQRLWRRVRRQYRSRQSIAVGYAREMIVDTRRLLSPIDSRDESCVCQSILSRQAIDVQRNQQKVHARKEVRSSFLLEGYAVYASEVY